MNWDDLRVVPAIAEIGSIRGAAERLGVSHVTVSRHLRELEQALGARLFDRSSDGYTLTAAGEDICSVSLRVQEEMAGLSRRIMGREMALQGSVRLTLPAFLAEPIVLPLLSRFHVEYPGIAIELVAASEHLSLSRREADIALRISEAPPEDLVGFRLGQIVFAVFGRAVDLRRLASRQPLAIVAEDDGRAEPVWWPRGVARQSRTLKVNDPLLALSAIRAGHGVGRLACCVGDADKALRRMPAPFHLSPCGLWLLTHADLRRSARVRVLIDFLAEHIRQQADLLEGRRGAHPGSKRRSRERKAQP